MAEFTKNWLSCLVFFPLVWATLGLLIPTRGDSGKTALKAWSLLGTLLACGFSIPLYHHYLPLGADFQFTESVPWLPSLGISYSLGLDGISLWLVLLTTFLMPLAVLCSFQSIDKRFREYYFLLLALETGMLGAFVSLDVSLFYVFWEAMLIPMYFMVGIWGGKDRIYAAMKFFLYTMVGSLLMLVAIFYLAHQFYLQTGHYSTLVTDLYHLKLASDGAFSPQSLLFLAFAFAFAIKVPLFPLHTWLPDAHVQAPTAGSVILAAILLKMGGYGLLRFAMPLFPQATVQYQFSFMLLGAIAIVYGAKVALVQPDLKKLVAYSSVSHMGYVILGLFSLNELAVSGSILQMLNHGVSTGGLFLLVGMIYERRHTREISDFGGLAKVMPLYTIAFLIVTLSSIALPGTNGFVGEFLILLGAWAVYPVLTAVAGLGVILGAVYMLWMFQRVLLGAIRHRENESLSDLSFREALQVVPLILAIFGMGLYPHFFFEKMTPSVQRFISRIQTNSDLQTRPLASIQSDQQGLRERLSPHVQEGP